MAITAEVIADSISPARVRLTTLQLRYPRFIHAEELTHRVLDSTPERVIVEMIPDGLMYDKQLSRNASSSRAVPVRRLIEDVIRDPVEPMHWGRNQPGMQAREELPPALRERARGIWRDARDAAISAAGKMADLGAHKQIVNRLLEPFAHINVVVTATEWENFFRLRDHDDAMPEIRTLARAMRQAMDMSIPREVEEGGWHLPYIRNGEIDDEDTALKVSVARCARVSYLTHDGRHSDIEGDVALYERLVSANPIHGSPTEHQARALPFPIRKRNLRGWQQLRDIIE